MYVYTRIIKKMSGAAARTGRCKEIKWKKEKEIVSKYGVSDH